ncbi:LysE family translocator [Celerinatantimonas diazotrophica]|uniref:Homoserine/homoserine lactone efflux protein n=1 Tax=Celerinatantimonas diazotrophica TaxID=412034 RepID=A0A4R1KEV3_9GAMM|nr:LysE family translocator [Celerinatantimonas diazotrophica]TCK63205.1 homoserine/homoserine lactone efflux protein [Celerinatantimonas diazotrophica]CAG9295574.1 Homoserine/homoserine lactone efflux protein [Celerinatantimonas diazotrophica]
MHGHVIIAFIGTFFVVSLTPGMCMTLSMTLGMTIGIKRTLWMMIGELIGVGIVAVTAVVGVAAIMLNYPHLFHILKYLGGAYLLYLGIQMWRSRSKLSLAQSQGNVKPQSRKALAFQGLITAIANPKGWAFMVSLLPPFIDVNEPAAPQLMLLVAMILCIEFTCLIIYASGGKTLGYYLAHSGKLKWLNRISGALMAMVGVWLAAS